ncbi:NAD(P)-dependent oxidoreductase [Williamsia sp.]|uniref:NAD(P)-dependent oxidoreductase n=1 Tax=Williamsia sp. TaxID=1872085 RepID=UPI001A21263C|nr:NAD(P)-dependent oxidoreductase [Williamsia sp.]MBJ7289908.1 NAD(P)-dependent oxidoreductase [Williamsia sp.]
MTTAGTQTPEQPIKEVGFIGLGDQGLPMARAIAEQGYTLHVWARRPSAIALERTPHTVHASIASLGAASDIVALCVGTDQDVLQLVDGGLLGALRPGSLVINHGTGTPKNARQMFDLCASYGVVMVDAPVSGGRPAAEARALVVLAGGPDAAVATAAPVFECFATVVAHVGGAGAGQLAKLFNNALLMMNQAAIADIMELAGQAGFAPGPLVDALRAGSADSRALSLMNTMVNPDTVGHLSTVEALEMDLFQQAMTDAGVEATEATARGLSGARRLGDVIGWLNH